MAVAVNEAAATDDVAKKLAETQLQAAADTASNDADEADDGSDDEEESAALTEADKKKKKNKKKNAAKKKKAKSGKAVLEQTAPPTVGLTKMFPTGIYPVGEIQEYDTTKFDESRQRTTGEELRERERLVQQKEGFDYNLIRRAAETHRQVRQYAQRTIKPGMSMTEIVNMVEDGTRNLVEANGFESGIGFPTGVSLNEVAAHYTPNAGDKRILQATDVLKVDFGVHVKGRIVDSAFTLNFEPTWDPLLAAVKEATNAGVKTAGIDVRLGDVGAAVQEVMESHEFDAEGKTHQVKCIRNLNGHNIEPYRIHGGKSVPIVAMPNLNVKMEEGEHFAIETFGSTGRGLVVDSGDCSHYARKSNPPQVPLRVSSARQLLYTINKNFGSLPFCRRYLDRLGEQNYLLGLKHLVSQGVVQDYPPLADVPGSMTAQYEHTILLRPTCKEVVSRGDDY
ncbi:methionyl aminopeptidase [Malassezia vespertilionis]|uniref:Methionine aminopeptidase 2 n=1 Tax=Malassezia vespertilionis TaxID=2020962 RepID=A0A2N1J783_9BASI|nr:methionyl aminopeptidase [Malassezia vespertilionis]PKI82400.1 Map2p [Malassezia vespertilionis]WFD08099.1 methionyl aminopeptidase [Malassezia vespertilionis]